MRISRDKSQQGFKNRAGTAPVRACITSIFPNRALLDILALFLLHQGEEFYQREIAERTGAAVIQVQRALRRIENAGLVTKVRRGNRVYYRAEHSNPVFEDLKNIILKTVALGDALRKAMMPLDEKIDMAFVFGSFAVGEESQSSDIDLLIVGTLSSREASRILGPAGRELGRAINPVIYPADELRKKAKAENRFIGTVIAGPKVWLIGNEDELRRLVA
ncbi:MAG: nucleotidyltransferase domain-containing protein [Candidatus Eisenbacteria bacterium]